MTAKISIVSAIVEVANKRGPKPELDGYSIQEILKRKIFNGHPVIAVIPPQCGDPVYIPTFGYDGNVEAWNDYEEKMRWGVTRLFGFTLVLDGIVDSNVLGTYEILERSLQVEICGFSPLEQVHHHEAKKINVLQL